MNVNDGTPLVAQTVDRFLADRCSASEWERVASSEPGWSRDNWREMAELGWLGICVPESLGGLGCGIEERMAVMEAIGQGLVLEPYLSTAVLCAELVMAKATDAQRQRLMPAIAQGRLVMALAATEPGARFAVQDVSSRAIKQGGGWQLSGHKIAVLDAPLADQLIVLARTSGTQREENGLSLFLVDPKATGVQLRTWPTVDRRRCSDIILEGVSLGAEALLGQEGEAFAALDYALDHAAVATCAEAVGAMSALVTMTIAHLKQRRQFGKTLDQFQVLRHRVADMHIACEQARALAGMAAATLLPDHPRRRINASAAKAQVGWSARFVGQQAVQLHGGMGMSNELRVGHYFKRLMAVEVLFGDTDHHLRRFGAINANPLTEFMS